MAGEKRKWINQSDRTVNDRTCKEINEEEQIQTRENARNSSKEGSKETGGDLAAQRTSCPYFLLFLSNEPDN